MFERFRRSNGQEDERGGGDVATVRRPEHEVNQPTPPGGYAPAATEEPQRDGPARRTAAAGLTAAAVEERRVHARREFGGLNWGAAFFGWLVAIGVAALLLAMLGAAGTALGLTNADEARDAAETIGLGGAILVLAVLMLAYFAGGYVAGRMSRFDGTRQGVGVWIIALVVTLLLAAAGVLFGAEYNILESLNLPRIPVDEGSLTTGAAIALGVIVIGTLLAAAFGGKTGERYHRRIDRFGVEDA